MRTPLAVSLLVLLAAGYATYAVLAATHSHLHVSQMLRPYGLEPEEPASADKPVRLGRSDLVRRAVDLTATVARRAGILQPFEDRLEQAAVQLQATDLVFFQVVAAVVLAAAAAASLVARRGVVLPIGALILVVMGPNIVLRGAIRRRRKVFTAQMPEALRMLANSLRTGRSFLQGMQAVAREAQEPIASELARVVAQARLGRAMEDALEEVMHRMDSADGALVVAAVRMQRRIGGNLAELLNNVADAIVARDRLRGEVRALTAEGRVSAIVLAVLPVGLGLVMGLVNPTYMAVLIHDPLGRVLLVGSSLLAGAGFLWMRKVMVIDV